MLSSAVVSILAISLTALPASATGVGPSRVAVSARARVAACAPPAASSAAAFVPGESCTGERVVITGATGYIGKAVVAEAVRRGYATTAVVRDASRVHDMESFIGATLVEAEAGNAASLTAPGGPLAPGAADVVICCLASRQGTRRDAWAVDYRATKACADAAVVAGCRHFVLLSAICVRSAERREPNALAFQYAKLEAEDYLRHLARDGVLSHSILRPTAFFKSLSNQFEKVAQGGKFLFFDLGGGACIRANPISEPDLAAALVDSIADTRRENAIWRIGGPGPVLSKLDQGRMMAEAAGQPHPEPIAVPRGVLDGICSALSAIAALTRLPPVDDAAEVARILRYYATEDMVTTDPDEVYGSDLLETYYAKVATEGREYDPYVAVFDSKESVESFGAGGEGGGEVQQQGGATKEVIGLRVATASAAAAAVATAVATASATGVGPH
mmetsp:Transcript_25010/g.77943  ORF Transcript_25010/g.77943 Transcript_25010/m.77943 type:complete len:446 (-) Transcript_25010:176-1513(-)